MRKLIINAAAAVAIVAASYPATILIDEAWRAHPLVCIALGMTILALMGAAAARWLVLALMTACGGSAPTSTDAHPDAPRGPAWCCKVARALMLPCDVGGVTCEPDAGTCEAPEPPVNPYGALDGGPYVVHCE